MIEANQRVYWDAEARNCVVKEVRDGGRLLICAETNPDKCWEVGAKEVRPQSEIEKTLVVDDDFWGEGRRLP